MASGAALVLVFGILGASVIWNIGPLSPIAWDVWQQVFPPFPPAGEDESLIIVADFDNRSEGERRGFAPDQYLYDQLLDRVEREGLDIRVERLYDVLNDNNARQIGEKYNATLVLWGWYDAVGVTPRLERMKGLQQRLTDEEGQVITLADPEQIAFSVVTDLPSVGSYITLFTLGADRYAVEEYAAARAYLTSAIAAVPGDEEVTAQPDEAYFLRGNIAYWPEQEYQAARRDYEVALALNPEDADTLNNLGVVAYSQGTYAEAVDYQEQALTLFRELGDRQGEANALMNRGNVAYSQGTYAEASAYYKQALARFRELGDRQGEVNTLGNLGSVAASQDMYPEARIYYEQVLFIARDLGDRHGEANALMGLGNIAKNLGAYPEARTYHEQALARFRELGDSAGIARTSWNLSLVYEAQGDMTSAVPLMQVSIDFKADIGHPDAADEANYLCWRGSLGGVATEVAATCEQAVALASEEEKPFYQDARGINRALTDDVAGAIEDFRFFVDELQGVEPEDEEMARAIANAVTQREAWIAALEAGENPFDEETLAALRNE